MITYFERIYYAVSILGPILMFAHKTPKRGYFLIRLISCFAFLVVVSCIYAYFLENKATYTFASSTTFDVLFFLSLLLVSITTCLVCYKQNLMCAFYCSIAGYCIQHLWGRLFDFPLYRGFSNVNLVALRFPFGLLILAIICVLFYYLFVRKMFPTKGNYAENNTSQIIVALFVVGINIVLNTYILNITTRLMSEYANTETYSKLNILFIFTCCMTAVTAFLCLFILIGLYNSKQIKDEKDDLNRMLCIQKQEYENQKNNINLINIKVHDLKHQLIAMNGKMDEQQLKETIKSVNIYDSTYHTGNEAIDIVLANKQPILTKNEIQLTCSLDGKLLSFIPNHEIYSIFGNAIDNAIESVSQLPVEKRIIHITQNRNKNILNILIQNYYSNKLEFINGEIQTTKNDDGYHGFGVKSIKMLVEKYGGTLTISAKQNIFALSMLFFLEDENKE